MAVAAARGNMTRHYSSLDLQSCLICASAHRPPANRLPDMETGVRTFDYPKRFTPAVELLDVVTESGYINTASGQKLTCHRLSARRFHANQEARVEPRDPSGMRRVMPKWMPKPPRNLPEPGLKKTNSVVMRLGPLCRPKPRI